MVIRDSKILSPAMESFFYIKVLIRFAAKKNSISEEDVSFYKTEIEDCFREHSHVNIDVTLNATNCLFTIITENYLFKLSYDLIGDYSADLRIIVI